MSTFAEGDEVTSHLFDGSGTVLEVTEDEELPRVHVRLPEDSGVATVAGIAAYAPEDLRRAGPPADRHQEKPLSLRLGPLRASVKERARELGVPVRRFILDAIAEKLERS